MLILMLWGGDLVLFVGPLSGNALTYGGYFPHPCGSCSVKISCPGNYDLGTLALTLRHFSKHKESLV
jgi:hypothetical protein